MKKQDLKDKISSVERKEISSTKLIDQCVQIAKDYAEQEAIEFGQWMHENAGYAYVVIRHTGYHTIPKLYQLFKNRENER